MPASCLLVVTTHPHSWPPGRKRDTMCERSCRGLRTKAKTQALPNRAHNPRRRVFGRRGIRPDATHRARSGAKADDFRPSRATSSSCVPKT
jgi:hypothetical protein